MTRRIDELSAPLCVTWQLTRDCDLACLHCCTSSAPGKAMPGELSREEALRLAGECAALGVPYVMLCGGEPLIVSWFWEVAEALGRSGVSLKIETNGQRLGAADAARLARLPIRSIQVSLDGDTEETYSRQRIGGSLAKAHAACRAVVEAGLPLEVTFAPTRLNLHEAEAVIDRASALGAFRLNTGRLMRLGTAAKLWERLEPAEADYAAFLALLERKERELCKRLELCFRPFAMEDGLRETLDEPPAVLLVRPDGTVKTAAALPFICADVRRQSLAQAWEAYRRAFDDPRFRSAALRVLADPARLAEADATRPLQEVA